ncbi:MAG: ATP-dependent DNA helicase PcrA [Planctomycetota bacterium]|nr:MAG: ATP-dependent DNA helicase PcrA [Planctomycetota bacterium]
MPDPLANLTEAQTAAVLHRGGPLLVVAGAGSGKTRVVTCRVAKLVLDGVPPWAILAITFTNKAANEMRERVAALTDAATLGQMRVSTFHSFCAWLLRRHAEEVGLTRDFSIYDEADQLSVVKSVMSEKGIDPASFKPGMIHSMISRAKNEMKGPEAYDEDAYDIYERTVARVYRGYQALLKVQNAVDFDDLLLKVVELFEKSGTTLEKYRKRFQHVLMDEYQDTNAAQYRIARALASGHRNICATGDPDQSIYSWRGADIRNILSFEEDFPGATVIKLEENFRSTGHILAAADMLIKNNTMRKERDLFTSKSGGEPVVVCALSDEQEEATYVAAEIARASGEGVPLRDIAVMYRVNALSRSLEEAMRAAGIAYNIVGSVEFYRRKEIKDILAYMKLMTNPLDDVSFGRIINVPARGIGLRTIERLKAFASLNSVPMVESALRVKKIKEIRPPAAAKVQRFTAIMQRLKKHVDGSAADAVRAVLEETNYLAFLDRDKSEEGLQRRENVGALVSAAFEFDQLDEEGGLRGFLEQVALVSDVDSWDDAEERVTLLTLHSAKGLEFRTAFIVGVEESLFPHVRSSETLAGLEEERRLAYVGITRAEEKLYLCYTHFRTQFGRTMRCAPSRFLAELDPSACEFRVSRTQRTPSRLATLDFDDDDDDPDDIEVSLELEDLDEPVIEYDEIGPDSPLDYSAFRAGVIVKHSRFGVGQILELSGSGSDIRARILFQRYGEKSLMLKYANLRKA